MREKQKAAPYSGFSPSEVSCQRRRDRTVQITEARAAAPASPVQGLSAALNVICSLFTGGTKEFNSCSVGQDKFKPFFVLITYRHWLGKAPRWQRPNDIQYYLVKNTLYNHVCVSLTSIAANLSHKENTPVGPCR